MKFNQFNIIYEFINSQTDSFNSTLFTYFLSSQFDVFQTFNIFALLMYSILFQMALLVESRSFRPFKSSEEYLYAMKEDLAEWLNGLYPELYINVNNFMDRLDTGVALCKVNSYFVIIIYIIL